MQLKYATDLFSQVEVARRVILDCIKEELLPQVSEISTDNAILLMRMAEYGPLSQSDIAKRCHTGTALSTVLVRLEAQGYVTRCKALKITGA